MAYVDGIDVPDELLDLWNKIFKLTSFGIGLGVKHYPARTNVARNGRLFNASLFVRWQSLYDAFTSDRRHSWDLYWETLPFGSHSGSNGWPGSGYSAFVYVNAPRFRDGLDLLLDPPFLNLVYNGDFALADDGWTLSGAYLDSGAVRFDAGLDFPFLIGDGSHEFDLIGDIDYRLEADIDTSGGDFEIDIYSNDLSSFEVTRTVADFSGHYSYDFTQPADAGGCVFAALAHEDCGALIDNISVIRI